MLRIRSNKVNAALLRIRSNSRSGLTYQAQSLEERGLVTRRPSPEDERSTIVTITDEGLDVLAKVFPGHVEAVRGLLFDSLSPGDAEVLERVITQVSGHLRANASRSAGARKRKAPQE